MPIVGMFQPKIFRKAVIRISIKKFKGNLDKLKNFTN